MQALRKVARRFFPRFAWACAFLLAAQLRDRRFVEEDVANILMLQLVFVPTYKRLLKEKARGAGQKTLN